MPRQYQTAEVSAFSKGLITEASPLTFPDGAALHLNNFVLNRDGTVSRRLGMKEQGSPLNTNTPFSNKTSLTNSFEWESPGGLVDRSLLVVQDGVYVHILDITSGKDMTDSLLSTVKLSIKPEDKASFASVDNHLVIASGNETVYRLSFDGESITTDSYRLFIRDRFGVDDGLTTGMDVVKRLPASEPIKDKHLYNLRNQTWALPRKLGITENTGDTVEDFSRVVIKNKEYKYGSHGGGKVTETITLTSKSWPSNADTVNQALYADVQDKDDRIGKRFFAGEVRSNPVGTIEAPKGYFIIDALNRGSSRLSQVQELEESNNYALRVSSLPRDRTPGGASVVQEYAGRVFYGGFSGAVMDGDNKSPQLSSYVLFSKLVRDPTDMGSCYAHADPTSAEDWEGVATDGGFLKIDGASNITGMRTLGNALFVLAENGIWSVSGGGEGFSATDIVVKKISEKGILSSSSLVATDQSLVYWSESGIFAIGPNEYGDYRVTNISNTTIQKLYDNIIPTDKRNAVGIFDSYEQKVRWQYRGNMELILDLNLNAFYTNTFGPDREVRGSFLVPPFRSALTSYGVEVEGTPVKVDREEVTVTLETRKSAIREVAYLIAGQNDESTSITIATLSDDKFEDWGSVDAKASLITGYSSFGDFQRKKDIPYLVMHFMRTEDGFDQDFNLKNVSSCLTRVAWDWANSPNSNKWTRQFQAYKQGRLYFPSGSLTEFDTGFETIQSKNKIRGSGRVFSLHCETEPLKDCKLLGWSLTVGVSGSV